MDLFKNFNPLGTLTGWIYPSYQKVVDEQKEKNSTKQKQVPIEELKKEVAKQMVLSEAGRQAIKNYEGLRLNAYKATPNEQAYTIGYGHYGVAPDMVINQQQADELFNKDISKFENTVNSLVKQPLNQNQYDALVSFVYNVGPSAFEKSTMLNKLNAGDYQGAANEFARWNKGEGGVVLPGLTKRRQQEATLFNTPISGNNQPQLVNNNQTLNVSPVEDVLRPDINLVRPFTSPQIPQGVLDLLGTSNETLPQNTSVESNQAVQQTQTPGGATNMDQNILDYLNQLNQQQQYTPQNVLPQTPVTQEQVQAMNNMLEQRANILNQGQARINALQEQYNRQNNPMLNSIVDIGNVISDMGRINHPVSMVGANGQVFTVGSHLANQDYKNALVKQMRDKAIKDEYTTRISLEQKAIENQLAQVEKARQMQSYLQLAQQTGLPLEVVQSMKGSDFVDYLNNLQQPQADLALQASKNQGDLLRQILANQGTANVAGINAAGDVNVENIKQGGANQRMHAQLIAGLEEQARKEALEREITNAKIQAQLYGINKDAETTRYRTDVNLPVNQMNAMVGVLNQATLMNDPRAKIMLNFLMNNYLPNMNDGGTTQVPQTNDATEFFRNYLKQDTYE